MNVLIVIKNYMIENKKSFPLYSLSNKEINNSIELFNAILLDNGLRPTLETSDRNKFSKTMIEHVLYQAMIKTIEKEYK